jgi:hypothetical protein
MMIQGAMLRDELFTKFVVVVVVWEGHNVVMREHRSTQPAAHTEAIRACRKQNSLYRPLDLHEIYFIKFLDVIHNRI